MPTVMPIACLICATVDRKQGSAAPAWNIMCFVGWTADEIWSSVEPYCSLPSYSKPFRTSANSSKAAKAGHPATGSHA